MNLKSIITTAIAIGAGSSLLLATSTKSASAVTINFDTLANNTVVTNQFPEVSFSSNPGFQIKTTAQSIGNSLPNLICTAVTGGGINCTKDVFLNFTAPVNNLKFFSIGDDASGIGGLVDVFNAGGFAGQVSIITDGVFLTPGLVDLSSFTNVTRIAINSVTDPGGLGFDDFSFDIGSRSVAVPEPSGWLGMGIAFGITAFARKRKLSQNQDRDKA
jgi:hypothetical protein